MPPIKPLWAKSVEKKLIDKEMTKKELSEKIGVYYSTDVINKVYEKRDKAKEKHQKEKTSQSMALLEKYTVMTGFISRYSNAVKNLDEKEKREARRKLLEKLTTWNTNYTKTENNIVKKFTDSEIEDADFYVNSLPSATLEKTKNKVKYKYTMTPDEYMQFTDDFLKALDKKRADVIKHGYNEEKTKLKLKEALSESKSEVIKNYKTKLDKKFVEKE